MNRIRELRIEADLTQRGLARKAKVRQDQLSRWEADEHEPRIESAQRIAAALGVSFDDLGLGRRLGADREAVALGLVAPA